MALYDMGASWNPKMSQFNRQIQRNLASVGGLSFAYRLNQWGPKVGPPMIPANLAAPFGFGWIEDILGVGNPKDIIASAKADLSSDLNTLPGLLSQIQAYLTQIQAYHSVSKLEIKNRAQSLSAHATGLAGSANNYQIIGQQLLGKIVTAQADTALTHDEAAAFKVQTQDFHSQIGALVDAIKSLGRETVSLLKDAGASSSLVNSISNTVAGSVNTLTWIVGGSLAAYFLLPTFLPRLAGGVRKAVRGA